MMENGRNEWPEGVTEESSDRIIEIGEPSDSSVACLKKRLERSAGEIQSSDVVCVYRVPQSLRGISEKAIEPEMVTIGPYHAGTDTDTIRDFETIKSQLVLSFLSRTRKLGVDLSHLRVAMRAEESSARRCYSESSPMSSDEFVDMMVIDGSFIVELFHEVCQTEDGGPILAMPWAIPIIVRDLLKLENQLPFFVLEKIFKLAGGEAQGGDPLKLLALKFFKLAMPISDELIKNLSNSNASHLLHLFHISRVSSVRKGDYALSDAISALEREILARQREIRALWLEILARWSAILALSREILARWRAKLALRRAKLARQRAILPRRIPADQSMQCATHLRSAGINFKQSKNSDSFLDIEFCREKRTLFFPTIIVPSITINDITSTVFVNCVALEQVNRVVREQPWRGASFSAYIAFMSCLINSADDVALLSKEGIITNFSHNDMRVAFMFKKLGEIVAFDFDIINCYLSEEIWAVGRYYRSLTANFVRKYYGNRWESLKIFANLLLWLTLMQTILASLSYIIHKS